MCLAIPGRIVEIEGNTAKADYGGLVKEINVTLVDVDIGQYVLVHAGYAIQIMNEQEAKETIALWEEILSTSSI